jgi:hypothetical protein
MEFFPHGQPMNEEFYCNVLRRLREDMRRCPEKWHMNDKVLHHDNARPYTAYIVQDFLATLHIAGTVFPQ